MPAPAWVKTLQATSSFIGNLKGLQTVSKVEAQQVDKLRGQLEGRDKWSAEDCSMAAEEIHRTVLQESSKQLLLEGIAQKLSRGQGCVQSQKNRQKLQDYVNIVYFLKSSFLKKIVELESLSQRLDAVMEFAVQLGMKSPTEATLGCLTCIAYWPEWRSCAPSMVDRSSAHQEWKLYLRRALQYNLKVIVLSPDVILESLPQTVE
ncbi:unnamed protein product, partial [Durusdinium trenchii]